MRRTLALRHSLSAAALESLPHFDSLAQLLGRKHALNETWWMVEQVAGKQRYEQMRYGNGVVRTPAPAAAPASPAAASLSASSASAVTPLSAALSDAELKRLGSMLHSRAILREPLQYLLGSVEFLGLPLLVRAPVLIPRPETECMVGWVLRRWARRDYTRTYKHLSVTHETDFQDVMQWHSASKRTAAEAAEAAAAPHAAHLAAAGGVSIAAAPASPAASPSLPPLRVLDLCSGSGNITLSLAQHLAHPSVHAVGVDFNPKAVQLARDNLARLQQMGFVRSDATRSVTCTFAEVDLLQTEEGQQQQEEGDSTAAALNALFPPQQSTGALSHADPLLHSLLHPPACVSELVRLARDQTDAASSTASPRPSQLLSGAALAGPYHLLVSNPPYIPLVEHATLQREVRDWEDFHALVAADEGMQIYTQILRALPSLLRPQASPSGPVVPSSTSASAEASIPDPSSWDVPEVVLEIGSALQAMQLAAQLQSIGFQHVTIHHDLADLPRWIAARRTAHGHGHGQS